MKLAVLLATFHTGSALRMQFQTEKKAATDAPSELVIIRTHNALPGLINRIEAINEDMIATMPNARLLISVDVGNRSESEYTQQIIDRIRQKAPSVSFHVYNETDVLHKYPHYFSLKGVYWHGCSRLYAYHAEPQAMAVQYAEKHFGMKFDDIWFLENDVIICGKLSRLLIAHHHNDADLLQVGQRRNPKLSAPCFWAGRATEAFKQKYKRPVCGFEWVIRYSNRLMNHVEELLEQGISGWSEVFQFTIPKQDGFKIAFADPKFTGAAGYKLQMGEEKANKLCSQTSPDDVVIHHAGKFNRDANGEFVKIPTFAKTNHTDEDYATMNEDHAAYNALMKTMSEGRDC